MPIYVYRIHTVYVLYVLAKTACLWRAFIAMAHCLQHDATTITILVYLTMLGQCMLPATIAYDYGERKDYTQLSDGAYSF